MVLIAASTADLPTRIIVVVNLVRAHNSDGAAKAVQLTSAVEMGQLLIALSLRLDLRLALRGVADEGAALMMLHLIWGNVAYRRRRQMSWSFVLLLLFTHFIEFNYPDLN